MKYILIILALLTTLSLKAQFPVANMGCFTYEYVPTQADTIVEIIPANVVITPAIYKDTVYQKVCSPSYTEQRIEYVNGQIKICNKTVPTQYINVCTRILVKPEQSTVIKPSYTIKCVTNVKAGYVMQVPCK